MFKKLASAIMALFAFATVAKATDIYNSVATAYLTTTISQTVVFDSNMQQGGTFDFSVLAHNGGGRAGQSDTANVKIEFYNSSNSLLFSQTTNYNGNLPNPNAVCSNPCIDSNVPWTTITVSKTLSAADAANVAYAKVYMWGIDGSYWAGDYGPWYRAPTLSLNGGGNLLYNPEFGPYNNVNAQGWNISPSLGACQGAWGGSNACIVDNTGTPGRSTTGLVANQNGGGPSLTGGTTSGTPGGYSSTMSVNNPSGAPTTPSAPTVVSTTAGTPVVTNGQPVAGTPVVTTTTVVRTVNGTDANGNPTVTTYNDTVTTTTTPYTTSTTTTPTTVTTYSDGSTTTTNGSPVVTTSSSSQTTTSTTAGGVQSVATTAPVAGAPVVTRGTTTTTSSDSFGATTTTSSAVRGTTVTTSSFADHASKNQRTVVVTRDTTTTRTTPVLTTYVYTTPVTRTFTAVTPITTTVTTTPTTTVTDANGNVISVTAAGPGVDTVTNSTETVVTTANFNDVAHIDVPTLDVTSSVASKSASASSVGLNDAIKIARNNPFLIDPLEPRDANWIAPRAAYYSVSSGKYMQGGITFGRQETVENNTFGVAFDASTTDSHGMLNSQNNSESYSGTAYLLSKQDYVWVKGAIGASNAKITGTTRIPEFIMSNSQKASQNLVYGDATVYSAESYAGFRPFLGAKLISSQVNYSSSGTALIAPNMPKKSTMEAQPYGGVRWEYDANTGLEMRVTKTRDFKTVTGVRGYVIREITDGVAVTFTVGADKGSHYSNVYGMVGLVVKF
jgi:hypothetical protein